VEQGALGYVPAGVRLRLGPARVPLPGWLSPRATARETAAETGRIGVHVMVTLPRMGLLIAYDGQVQVVDRLPPAGVGRSSASGSPGAPSRRGAWPTAAGGARRPGRGMDGDSARRGPGPPAADQRPLP
jgi:hypothetical protein